MNTSSVTRVINRINAIETKFIPNTRKSGEFARQLSEVIQQTETTAPANNETVQVERIIRSAADRHGVKPDLALAVASAESGLSQRALSPVGAVGVMQLMPETAQTLGVSNIHDVRENVDGGVRYLRQMLNTFNGNERYAIAAYNAGPGAVQQYGGIPPYPETEEYVARVLRNLDK